MDGINVMLSSTNIDIDADFNVGHSRAAACAEFEICVWTRKSPLLVADISLHTSDIVLLQQKRRNLPIWS